MSTINSSPTTVKIPSNYPLIPEPGKISLLFNENSENLYHKFDARNYDDGNGFGFKQPYIYRYPGHETNKILQTFSIQSRLDDVVRVTEFIASGRGVKFVAKQFFLQGFQPFDETNIYNPTEVVLSSASHLTFGILESPKRHIDKSGGLLGGLASLIGVGISRGNPPSSTVAAGDGSGGSTEGSLFGGLSLLGGGGNRETEVLPIQNYGNGTGLLRAKTANKARSILQSKLGVSSTNGGIFSFVKNIAKSIIPQVFGADKQNYKQRADELAYDWMIKYYNDNTANNLATGIKGNGLSISFLGINLKNMSSTNASTQITNASVMLFKQKYYNKTEAGSFLYNKDDVFIKDNEDTSNIKKKYENLNNLVNNTGSFESVYYKNNIRTLDSSINPYKNYGLSGNGKPDRINTLTILEKDKKIKKDDILIPDYTEWNPYNDDLIAFFFYDVVNSKYVPFRATIRGINEANNALWDELRFIGRSDALYSYSGFIRNLSFSFSVVVNSLIELYPVWKRINYLASSVKPSQYTQRGQGDNIQNKFIVPPMFMLTIGDLYKYQPIVITSVGVNIPDGSIWELTNDLDWENWPISSKTIKTKDELIGKVAQVPREIEISVACNLLEKELPQIGRSHYGHCVVNDKYEKLNGEEYLPQPGNFSINIREDSDLIPRG